jgi:hypothetical protein
VIAEANLLSFSDSGGCGIRQAEASRFIVGLPLYRVLKMFFRLFVYTFLTS